MTEHARVRAKERYGLDVSMEDIKTMVGMIIRRETVLVKRMTEAGLIREIHLVRFGGKVMVAFYNPFNQALITFLPQETVLKGKHSPAQIAAH